MKKYISLSLFILSLAPGAAAQCTISDVGLDPVTQRADIRAVDITGDGLDIALKPYQVLGGSRSIVVERTDDAGVPVWQKRITHTNPDFRIEPFGILTTQDGGLLVYGDVIHGPGPSYLNQFVIRLDDAGEVLWARLYMVPEAAVFGEDDFHHGRRTEHKRAILELPDGRFKWVIQGWLSTCVVTLDANGMPQTAHQYYQTAIAGEMDYAARALVGPDGSVYCSYKGSGFLDVSRVAPDGTIAWTTRLTNDFVLDPVNAGEMDETAIELADNGDLVLGGLYSFGSAIARLSGTGQLLWTKSFNLQWYLYGMSVLPGGDVLVGIENNVLRLQADGSAFTSVVTNGLSAREIWSSADLVAVSPSTDAAQLALAAAASAFSTGCGFTTITSPVISDLGNAGTPEEIYHDTCAIKTWTLSLEDGSAVALDVVAGLSLGRPSLGRGLTILGAAVNSSSTSSGPTTITCTLPAGLDLVSIDPAPASVVGEMVTWELPLGIGFGGYWDFTIRMDVPAEQALLGTNISCTIDVDQALPETDLTNNTLTKTETIVGAWDPNAKFVSTSSSLNDSTFFLGTDQWLDYTICFQNTGNFPAEDVVLVDTLPADLRVGSFTMMAATHPYIYELGGDGVLKFIFSDINLPDSVHNEPGSHGAVTFRIRPRPDIAPGTLITNRADIFFDLNPAVRTDDSRVWVEFPVGLREVSQPALAVFPVPVADRLTALLPAGFEVRRLRVQAMDGRCVMNEPVRTMTGRVTADVGHLVPQVYVLTVEGADDRRLSARFVKQ